VIETLDTIYGPMSVLATDTTQVPWMKTSGASVEDFFIEMVRGLLGERPRGTIVDVGASYGAWSLALADLAERIIALEPQPVIFSLLVTNLAHQPKRKGRAWNCAAWNRSATLKLPVVDYENDQQYAGNFGGVSLKDSNQEGEYIEVEARRLDEVIPRGIDVSFIKADVEGAEREVLLGATETIRRCRPILFVEFDHKHTHREGLQQQIESMSYVVQTQGPNYLCLPLSN
jgi:FkbM family methyltransferase